MQQSVCTPGCSVAQVSTLYHRDVASTERQIMCSCYTGKPCPNDNYMWFAHSNSRKIIFQACLHCGQSVTSWIRLSISIDHCSAPAGPTLKPVAPHTQAYQPISIFLNKVRSACKSTSSTLMRQRAFVINRRAPALH